MQLGPSNCCSFESFACCNLAKCLSAAPQTAPALQQKTKKNVQPRYITLVWHWWFTFQRNSGEWQECVYNTSCSRPGKSGYAWALTAGQVQTSLQESLGSQHLEECTGADTRQQTIPANTWSIWHFAGPMPMTSSCGIVIGPHTTKEKSPLSCVFFFFLLPPVLQYPGQANPSTLSCSFTASQLMVV